MRSSRFHDWSKLVDGMENSTFMTMDYIDRSHNSKEIIKLKELWQETWEKLTIKNPFRIESLAILHDDFEVDEALKSLELHHCVYHSGLSIKEFVEDFGRTRTPRLSSSLLLHLTKIFTNHIESINNYCDAHNIQLVNKGDNPWEIIEFMNLFLGDFNNSKVVLWHDRLVDPQQSWDPSGEFVIFDRKFAEECLSNNKFPKINFSS